MYRYVIVSPGQGVQRPGMLDPWLDLPSARDLTAYWSDLIGADLIASSRDENSLRDTAVAQPVIVATALLSLRLLREKITVPGGQTLFAGHSVGELAAAAGAGYLSEDSALLLADARGRSMSQACATSSTGMAAVMPAKRAGASDEEIEERIQEAGLAIANYNGCNQFVAAGPLTAVEEFAASPPNGMRVMKLEVAGAFHTSAMASAADLFAQAMANSSVSAPTSPMLGNSDGAIIEGPDDFRKRLVAQLSSEVRWDLCSATITSASDASTLFIELAPAGPLARLAERSGAEFRVVAIRAPEEVVGLSDERV